MFHLGLQNQFLNYQKDCCTGIVNKTVKVYWHSIFYTTLKRHKVTMSHLKYTCWCTKTITQVHLFYKRPMSVLLYKTLSKLSIHIKQEKKCLEYNDVLHKKVGTIAYIVDYQ